MKLQIFMMKKCLKQALVILFSSNLNYFGLKKDENYFFLYNDDNKKTRAYKLKNIKLSDTK